MKITPITWIRKVQDNSVTLYNIYNPSLQRVEKVDNLILITGRFQNNSLYKSFKNNFKDVHLIGDARIGGARIGNAIFDANELGRKI
jgi:predicted KAP-like P-loop ATPase